MNDRTLVALCLSALVLALAGPLARAQPRRDVGALTLTVRGLRSAEGEVRCALYRGAEGWPSETRRAVATDSAPIRRGRATCRFEGVSAGRLAIAAYHDEDDDGELDKNMFGAPTEGWGVTRGARGGAFSGPSFEEAVIAYDGVSVVPLRIEY